MSDESFERNKTRSPKGRLRARCPACSAWVLLRDTAEIWDLVNCPECQAVLEIVELRPPTLDYADTAVDEAWELVDEDEDDWEDSRR